ncbi:Serine/threonine protein kinase [Melghirimyces algeriensis]|uniref:Serine/threonine-protein kinase PrkC n=1 Tax=Melghirimyces algeriensis TaxID=910412 RepID=A0A521DNE5_9BACL|nr:Serine/threonine protein kinase [Melghirimyces algeriensis]
MVGKRLGGRYQIVERIGGGGMAVVYKAEDTALGRHVAIKVMNESLSHDETFIRRFHREARAAGSLSHPHVVNVYDAGNEGHTYYIVMEYIEGPTLMELVQQRGRIPYTEAVTIASQICEGLAHAHENGIVHRDIKPHNIMATAEGVFKLADFGISRSTRSSTITQTGFIMGSVHYFSPEQAGGREVRYTSDLYSLGVVLYEMVTGQLPFDGEEAVAIALKHLQEQVPDPRTIVPDIPEELCRVIFQLMEKNPEHRFTSALEVSNILQSIHSDPVHFTEMNKQEHFKQPDPQPLQQTETADPDSVQSHTGEQTAPQEPPLTGSRRDIHSNKRRSKKWIINLVSALAVAMALLIAYNIYGNDTSSNGDMQDVEAQEKQPADRKNDETSDQAESNPPKKTKSGDSQSPTTSSPDSDDDTEDAEEVKEEPGFNWKAYRGETENDHFREISTEDMGDGKYQISLKTDFGRVYYDVLIYDRDGPHQPVIRAYDGEEDLSGEFHKKTFSVEVSPPEQGLVKIRLYDKDKKEEAIKILDVRDDD